MKNIRIHLIDVDFYEIDINTRFEELTDQEFINISEEQGEVYTLEGFTNAVNNDNYFMLGKIIRFIKYNPNV